MIVEGSIWAYASLTLSPAGQEQQLTADLKVTGCLSPISETELELSNFSLLRDEWLRFLADCRLEVARFPRCGARPRRERREPVVCVLESAK